MGAYETLVTMNVNEYIEKKNGLAYLTWSWAWDATKRKYPDASYTVWKNDNGLPYVYDELTGYMVYTSVTIEGITHEMWLPVMDSANKAMKSTPYTYKVKNYKTGQYIEKTVEPATMFDVNKTIMRCLVKNLAMFGLGLYIYAGEDLPQQIEEEAEPQPKEPQPKKNQAVEDAQLKTEALKYLNEHNDKDGIKEFCKYYKIKSTDEITVEICKDYLKKVGKIA